MSENERKFQTTTISTIAIHSGKTKIVMALLQSGDLLELKILELVPGLTVLGETFEEASELENTHCHVLQQLQNKQSPVEELLRKADQVIADRKPQAEVYIAMADSLGQAWNDINSYLMLRKHILHLNVTYHSKAEACAERMRVLELLCLSPMPTSEEMLKESLECMQEVKKSLLECLMGALKAGQSLLVELNELSSKGAVDSRIRLTKRAAQTAIAQVETWMEDLHNRRRLLDVTWQRRKLNLDKYRTLSILKYDLEILETLLKERYKILVHGKSVLGTSALDADDLLKRHLKILPEAKNLQEEGVRMVKASEQLPSSSHKFSEESHKIAYNVLNLANEYMQAINDREQLLRNSVRFFNEAKSVILKLEEMNYQLKNVNSTSERLIIMNMTDEITKDIIKDGYSILEYAPGANGIEHTLSEIENTKSTIMDYCIKENDEIFEVSRIVNTFYEKYNQIYSWLVTTGEATIQRHQDMGGGLQSCQNFLYLHKKLINDIQLQSNEISKITDSVPREVRERLQPHTKDDIANKVDAIVKRFNSLKKVTEERVALALKFVDFHSLAITLETELDAFSRTLSISVDSQEVLQSAEPASLKIKQLHTQLSVAAEDFLNELMQTRDSYLDAKRAQLCVETVLEHFANRKSDLEDKWNIWEESTLDRETSRVLWTKNMEDSENTIDWVVKLETQLYPVLNSETTDVDTQIQLVEHKLNHIIPEIKRAQQEIQLRIRTAKELIVGGALDNNVEVPPKLQELHDSVCNIIVEYTIFLEVLASFLKSVRELDQKIIDLKEMNEVVCTLSPNQLNDVRIKHIAASKAFFDLWKICYNESRRVTEKIQQQEPAKFIDKDTRAVDNLIETRKLEWDSLSANVEQSLNSLQTRKQFDQDFDHINTVMKELSDELTTVRNQYNLSLSAAKSSSLAFQSFEKTVETTEMKMKSLLNVAEETIKVNESRSEEIEQKVRQAVERWTKFWVRVLETKREINTSIQYFSLIDETEECFREGTKLLVSVARKSSTARSPEEAEQLLKEIIAFLRSTKVEQEERIRKISTLVTALFDDDDERVRQLTQIKAENQDMLESFSTVSRELKTLHHKLGIVLADEDFTPEKKSSEIVSVEKLPTPLAVEKVEVIHVQEDEPPTPLSQEIIDIMQAYSVTPSSPPVKKTKFSEESTQSMQAPIFLSPLVDVQVQEGSKFIFECEVTGHPVPEIVWFKEGLSIDNNPDYKTTFENGVCRLSIEEVFAEDSAKFTCRAVNEVGVAETSATLLIIEKNTIEDELQPPSFVVPLQNNMSVKENESCELYCKVTGNPLPVIQWSRNDVCVESHPYYEITYNNGDGRLKIKNASPEDDATFTCCAVNPVGTLLASCVLKVLSRGASTELPAFSSCLSNVMVRAGQKLKLECSITGKPFPNLTWYHNGKPLKELPNIIISVDDSGYVVFVILEAFPKDAGEYTLVASNPAGEISCSCNVSVKGLLPYETSDSEIPSDIEPLRPSISAPLSDVVAADGSEALLECVIVGQPEPEVIWYHNDVPVKEGDRIQLHFKGDKCSLLIKKSCVEDAGVYKVVAINSAGEISSTCQLTVSEDSPTPNTITQEPELTAPKFDKLLSDVLIREGDTAVLECSVIGYPEPEIKWFLNSSELRFDDRVRLEKYVDGSVTLTVQNVTPEDKGLYTVRASNSLGEAKCFSHVIVKSLSSAGETKSSDVHLEDRFERPTFTELFHDRVVAEGESVKFECIVKGKPAPKVRWLFNNEAVSGKSYLVSTSGDRQVLCIPEVGQQNAGLVTCVAKNDVGEACCEAYLRLNNSITEDKLLPTLTTTMNVFESSNSYEMKQSTLSKSVAFNNEPPVSKTDSYTSVTEQSSRRINDSEPVKTESRHVEEKHEMTNGTTTHSDLLISPQIQYSKQNGASSLKPARKQTAPRFISTIKGAIVDPGRDVTFEAAVETRFEDGGQYKVKAHNEAGETVSLAPLNVFEPPPSIVDSCKFSESYIGSKSTANSFVPPFCDFSTNMQISELNNADRSSGFSETVEITKTDKRVAFANGLKVQDDFNTSKEKFETRDKEKSVSFAPLNTETTETYRSKSSDQINATNFTQYSQSDSTKEIEMLQKPLVYPDMESFRSYSSYNTSTNDEFILEPGPPPEIGYIPKEAVSKTREPMAERVKKLESSQRQLSPVEIPPGAVKIFPTIIPKRKDVDSTYEKKYSSCIKEYKNSLRRSDSVEKKNESYADSIVETPNIRASEIEKIRRETEISAPICRLQADHDVRPQSPRPSAEGLHMERLWSQKKTVEDQQSSLRPVTPRTFAASGDENSSAYLRTDLLKRSQSPLPSAEGVAMDKLWAHPRSRPHSVIGMDGLNGGNISSTNTEACFKSEKVESTTWTPGAGPAQTTGRTAYEDVHKVNDQVVSRNKFDQSYSNYAGNDESSLHKVNDKVVSRNKFDQSYSNYAGNDESSLRTVSNDRGDKKANKKFKWPPEEVSIQDSLVRRMSNSTAPPSSVVEQKSCMYGGSSGSSKTIVEKQDSFASNQTLPRSFKFKSSNESKFQPVKSFSPLGRRNSDYDSDFEVTKISKEACWKPGPSPQPQHTVSSSSFSKELVTNLASEKRFSSPFPKPGARESGYSADTEESYRGGAAATCFVPKQTFPQQYMEPSRTQTLPRVSDHKISSVLVDDTKLASTKKAYAFTSTVPSPSKFTKSQFRESETTTYESDYEARIPPIWRPSDREPAEKCYRPVRPNLTPVPKPFYNRSTSSEGYTNNSEYVSTINVSKSNFQPVSPATAEYSSTSVVSVKPNPAFSTDRQSTTKTTTTTNERQYSRHFSNEGDTYRNEVFQSQTWQKPTTYEGHYSMPSSDSACSPLAKFAEIKKKQKVEEIRKRFESNGVNSCSNEPPPSMTGYGDGVQYSNSRSRISDDCMVSRQHTETITQSSYKSKSQQIIDNIVNNVNSKQRELKQGAMKSPSLFSPPIINDHQVFKEHYRNTTEHVPSSEVSWTPELSRSTDAEYVIVNGNHNYENEGPCTAPLFSTPLHDIAAVIGSQARFECIVQSDSPFEIEWRKDGEVVNESELHQISLRNGVCKLTLLKTYMYDAGTYQCIAINRAGVAETSATLIVSGERRSYIKK